MVTPGWYGPREATRLTSRPARVPLRRYRQTGLQGQAALGQTGGTEVDTGMVRKIDDLGRIVIPAETRRILNIHEGDELAIAVEGDRIILRKREATVAVGEHVFELDRNAVAEWERKLTTDVGSKEAEQIEAEIRRRLGL